MKTLYLDIFSGISGDMFLGAMIDLGVPLPRLKAELDKLGLGGYHLHAPRRNNSGIEGVKFDVHLEGDHHHEHGHSHSGPPDHSHSHEHSHSHPHEHEEHEAHGHAHGSEEHQAHDHEHATSGHHREASPGWHEHEHEHAHHGSRDFAEIKALIQGSTLSDWVKKKAIATFERVAVAEGKVHGQPPEKVHFHEVGAVDSIVDIVGAAIALELLGKPRVLAAPVVEGRGWVDCAHGRFPVPTTATLEILGARGIALTQCDEPHELVTPTGAALLAECVESFGPMHGLVASRIGYGLGTRQNKTRPNVLRAVLGESASTEAATQAAARDWEIDTITVLETNLDDCTAEIIGYVAERALSLGALDVFHTPIQMKKNRPGVLLTILCATADADSFTELLLRETSAFGVRRYPAERRKLRRESVKLATAYGQVEVKLGKLDGQLLHAAPEFESCKKLAAQREVPVRLVYEAAVVAIRQSWPQESPKPS